MGLSTLASFELIALCVIIAFLNVGPVRSLALPQQTHKTKDSVSRESALQMCLDRISAESHRGAVGQNVDQDPSSQIQEKAEESSKSSPSSLSMPSLHGIDCKALLESSDGNPSFSGVIKDTAAVADSGAHSSDSERETNTESVSTSVPNADESVKFSKQQRQKRSFLTSPTELEMTSNGKPGASQQGIPASSELFRAGGKNIDPAEMETMLKAHNFVKHVMEEMGVGEGEEMKNKRQDSMAGNSDQFDHTGLLALARMNVLAKLKKSLLRADPQTGQAWMGETREDDRFNSLASIFSTPSASKRASVFSPNQHARNIETADTPFLSSPASSAGPDSLLSRDDSRDDSSDTASALPAQKRGYSGWYSRPRGVYKRRRGTMSINNAMMAITDMLLAEQKERLQRNRESIRYHMLVQG